MSGKFSLYWKRFCLSLLSLLLIIGLLGATVMPVSAEEVATDTDSVTTDDVTADIATDTDSEENLGRTICDSGVSGGIKWTFYTDGHLDVKVSGDLPYEPHSMDTKTKQIRYWPWYHRFDVIKTVKVSGKGLTKAQHMFDNIRMTSIDLSGLDTSQVTNMECMFDCCASLKTLDLSNFNTSKVTKMGDMFGHCEALTKVNVSSFDTRNVTDMHDMFICCRALKKLDLSNFNTKKVTTMGSMFTWAESLEELNISSFDTSNVTSMGWMFYGCGKLRKIDVSKFNTSKAESMSAMFVSCASLQYLDLSSFDMSKATGEEESLFDPMMLNGCKSLIKFKTPKKLPKLKIANGLPATFINKSGVTRDLILDANDVYVRWDVPVTGIKLDKTSLKMANGRTVALKATLVPDNASLKSVKWKSSNTKIAKVDQKGNVTALKPGNVVITAISVDGSKTAKCKVTVLESVVMYRLYNPNSGEHFYTGSQSEIKTIVAAGWKNEGIAWSAPVSSKSPVYRLYNPNAGDHHYTVSASEKNSLVKAGWKYEGIGWYSDDKKGVPLYRLYNPNASSGAHHYTTSASEKNNLVKAGWKYEGIAWYGMK